MHGRKTTKWFSFKGVRSDEMGIYFSNLPDIPVADERGSEVDIPGRDGTLWVSDGTLLDVSIPLTVDIQRTADIRAIAAWLTGFGELVFSDQPNYCYHARITAGYALTHGVYLRGIYRAELEFTANPYKFQIGNPAMADMLLPTRFDGDGSVYSRPIITVFGTGDVNLMVNDCTVMIENIDEYITLDCEAMMATKDGENLSPRITLLTSGEVDEWPSLRPSGQQNYVNWWDEVAGTDEDEELIERNNVTKVVVQPNWRWR